MWKSTVSPQPSQALSGAGRPVTIPVTAPDGRFIGMQRLRTGGYGVETRRDRSSKKTRNSCSGSLPKLKPSTPPRPSACASSMTRCAGPASITAWRNSTALPPEAHIGKRLFGNRARPRSPMRSCLPHGDEKPGEPCWILKLSGSAPADAETVRYWNNRWVPLKDEAGRVIGVSVAIEETTERRRAEESLRRERAALSRDRRVYRLRRLGLCPRRAATPMPARPFSSSWA